MRPLEYELPEAAIAQTPREPRSAARLLVSLEPGVAPAHAQVADLATFIQAGDVMVVNDSRVLPARLTLTKPTGGAAEVLLLEDEGEGSWQALVRRGRRLAPGVVLVDDDGAAAVEVGIALADGRRRVQVLQPPQKIGHVALPPYIHTPLADPNRYQTVYANRTGSVAAPTAGLHLTDGVLEECQRRGATIARVDLAIGLDTFRPIAVADLDHHVMHSERYSIPAATMAACEGAARVVAVGTTVVRALEAAAASGDLVGRTDLFIRPGYSFKVVDALLTNFHMPRSTLLVLLAAFCGDRWRELYELALREGYRFLSFGDAMFVSRLAA